MRCDHRRRRKLGAPQHGFGWMDSARFVDELTIRAVTWTIIWIEFGDGACRSRMSIMVHRTGRRRVTGEASISGNDEPEIGGAHSKAS